MKLTAYLKLMRPWQWVKNGLLFLPAFFAQNLSEPNLWFRLILAALAFSLLSSVVYVINDYVDREQDRQHPEKKDRPLASGTVSGRGAAVLIGILLSSAFGLALFLKSGVFIGIMIGYALLNLGYSFGLKRVPLLDIMIISLGFQLRIFAGGAIALAPISRWLVLMIFLGALMLSLGKRRSDLLIYLSGNKPVPSYLKAYDLSFSNYALGFLAAISTVAYILYTMSEEVFTRIGHEEVYFTNLFVVMGMLRYLQLVLMENKGSKPSIILIRDPFLLTMIIGWIISFALLLYWL